MSRLAIEGKNLLLSLPSNVWRLIVFAPFLIIIILLLLFLFLSFFLSVDHELVGPKVFSFVVKGVNSYFEGFKVGGGYYRILCES